MHARTEETAAKVIGRKCSIHYVEEYSHCRNYNRTYDLWIWTNEPRAIPRGGSFSITAADEEGLPTDIPLPDLEPCHNLPPEEPKEGWTYPYLIHVDTLQDLLSRKARAFKWEYKVQDNSIRYKKFPLGCRPNLELTRRQDEDDNDNDQHNRGRHRSRSLWNRLGGRSSSHSRDPDRSNSCRKEQDFRGRPRERERNKHRSRSGRSRDPSEGCDDVLDILESHLDPMLHEATVQRSMYSPDSDSHTVASPVFSLAAPGDPEGAKGTTQVGDFIANISDAVPPPILPTPEAKHYKQPLSSADMKTITQLVEKGGCKSVRLKHKSKKAAVAPV